MPGVVAVNVTEQLLKDNMQVFPLSEPPVLPAVRANVTKPIGTLVEVVMSTTVAVTAAEQLAAPDGMLQLTFETAIDVASLGVAVTMTVAEELVLGLCVESPI